MFNIAIDGYSSTGKGVVSSELAKKLGIIHFDTGAIYRVIGLYVKRNNIDPNDESAVSKCLDDITVDIKHSNGEQITILNGEDVSNEIRTSEISNICSITSPYKACRDFVLEMQRKMASKYDLVMEGRDITSHVLPDANFKFFLDANIDVRTKRRYNDLVASGEDVSLDQVKDDLIERDRRDMYRPICPLILTKGTIHIDNSFMTIDEEVDLMIKIIKGER